MPPVKIGRVGKVTITNRKGHQTPTTVELMSESDFDELQKRIDTWARIDEISAILGEPSDAPKSRMYTFYQVKKNRLGWKRAEPKGKIALNPKYIDRIVFSDIEDVSN
jgi:hypothetical protein